MKEIIISILLWYKKRQLKQLDAKLKEYERETRQLGFKSLDEYIKIFTT